MRHTVPHSAANSKLKKHFALMCRGNYRQRLEIQICVNLLQKESESRDRRGWQRGEEGKGGGKGKQKGLRCDMS